MKHEFVDHSPWRAWLRRGKYNVYARGGEIFPDFTSTTTNIKDLMMPKDEIRSVLPRAHYIKVQGRQYSHRECSRNW